MQKEMNDVSVIIPSYNHGKYVLEAVKSVLRQTVPPKEVIIVDDASQDDTIAKLGELDDPRIRLIVQPRNQGGSETLNVGIRAARFDLLAICNSDDIWEPHKLERQLETLEANPQLAAIFTDVEWIGEYGQSVKGFPSAFRTSNKTRYEWVRHLVENGNCLCHPSVLIRSEVYRQVGEYDNRLRQLPDYKMWLSAACHFDFHVMKDKLVRFRIHDNTSAPSPAVNARDRNECALILEELIGRIDSHTFFRAFGTHRSQTDKKFNLEIEKIIYLWTVEGHLQTICRNIANRLGMALLATEDGRQSWINHGLSMRDFHVLHGISSPWQGSKQRDISRDEAQVLTNLGRHSPTQTPLISRRHKLKREIQRIKKQLTKLFNHS